MNSTQGKRRHSAAFVPTVAIVWFVAIVNLTPAHGKEFPIPSTISKSAQTALSQFSRVAANVTLPAPDDVESWKSVQAAIERKRADANSAVASPMAAPKVQ